MVDKLKKKKKKRRNHSIHFFATSKPIIPLKKKKKRKERFDIPRTLFYPFSNVDDEVHKSPSKKKKKKEKRRKGEITRAIHHEIADLSLDSLVHPRLGRHPRAEKQRWTEAAGDIQTFIVEILLGRGGRSRWEVIPARCSTHPRCHLRRRDNVSAPVSTSSPLRLGQG